MSIRIIIDSAACRPYLGDFARVVGDVLPAARTAAGVLARNKEAKHAILLHEGVVEGGVCYVTRAEAGVEYMEVKLMAVRKMNQVCGAHPFFILFSTVNPRQGLGSELWDALFRHMTAEIAGSHTSAFEFHFFVYAQGISSSFFANQVLNRVRRGGLSARRFRMPS